MKTNTTAINNENKQQQFVDIKNHNDYEISIEFPHIIRRKSNKYVVHEFDTNGYPRITVNGKKYFKHRIIALKFIENDDPENKTEVDHCNRNRSDYHIENLRWVTPSENQRNKASYNNTKCEYVDDLSDDKIELTDYGDHEFEFDWFDNDQFYYYTGNNYRMLEIKTNPLSKTKYVNTRDINNKPVRIYINKFKKLYKFLDE